MRFLNLEKKMGEVGTTEPEDKRRLVVGLGRVVRRRECRRAEDETPRGRRGEEEEWGRQ